MNAVDIAKVILGTEELPPALETKILRVDAMCANAGGRLRSRQAIAMLIEMYFQDDTGVSQ